MKHLTRAASLLILLACSASASTKEIPASKAVNAFALELCRKLSQEGAGGNLFFSPLGTHQALGMTMAGAGGSTREGMAKALALEGPDLPRPLSLASGDPKITLAVANALWGRKGMVFRQDFLDTAKGFYGAGLSQVDFENAPDGALRSINDWVSEKTRKKIPALLSHIDPMTRLLLTNAVYFKGEWAQKFDKALTKDGPFLAAGGAKRTVPMMTHEGGMPYFKGKDFQVLRLDYGQGDLGMVLLLPDAPGPGDCYPKGPGYFLHELTAEKWEGWMNAMQSREGTVTLPRFKMEYGIKSLKPALQEMGMVEAFTPAADFSGMTGSRDLCIGNVYHKAVIEVNEEGSEAAAATAVEMLRAEEAVAPFTMRLDRPFLFAIRDNRTGALLFLGLMQDPG